MFVFFHENIFENRWKKLLELSGNVSIDSIKYFQTNWHSDRCKMGSVHSKTAWNHSDHYKQHNKNVPFEIWTDSKGGTKNCTTIIWNPDFHGPHMTTYYRVYNADHQEFFYDVGRRLTNFLTRPVKIEMMRYDRQKTHFVINV